MLIPTKTHSTSSGVSESAETLVGNRIKELRNKAGLSLRQLAARSGLNINTLSLVENGKTSPSVSTLQQLAHGLSVPISAFFESETQPQKIVWTRHDARQKMSFDQMIMESLGKDLGDNVVQPFLVTLEENSNSGEPQIVHTGHEFVYCLSGKIQYTIDQQIFSLVEGDSLLFEAHLPHRWQNGQAEKSQFILILFPADQREEYGGRHFSKDKEQL